MCAFWVSAHAPKVPTHRSLPKQATQKPAQVFNSRVNRIRMGQRLSAREWGGRLAVVYSASSSGPRRTRRTDTTPFGQTRDLRKLRSQFTFQQLVRGPTHSASSALNECTQCDERQTEFALGLMCFKERSPFGVYADYIEVINNCVRVGLSDLFAAHR